MAQAKNTMYDSLINTMISTVGNVTVTESTTTSDVTENFSSNNVRSVIISPDVIFVLYHVEGASGRKYIVKHLSPDVTKSLEKAEEENFVPMLYGLGKPFVCGNLEEIIIFTKSGKDAFKNTINIPDRDIDLRNLKSKSVKQNIIPIRQLYSSYVEEDIANLTRKDLVVKFNKMLKGTLAQLLKTKYVNSSAVCKQFFSDIIIPAIRQSVNKSTSTTIKQIRTEVYNDFVKIVKEQVVNGVITEFTRDVLDIYKKEIDKDKFEPEIIEQIQNEKKVNDRINNEFASSLKGFDRFVGIYIYDVALELKDCNVIVSKVSNDSTKLLHDEISLIQKPTMKYEVHIKDWYKNRVKEQSSLYGEIDLRVAKHLDNIKEQLSTIKPTVEIKENKKKTATKEYLEKAREVDNWLYLYDALKVIIQKFGFNSLKNEFCTMELGNLNNSDKTKISHIDGCDFKYLKQFEDYILQQTEEENIEKFEYIQSYIHRNILKFYLENMDALKNKYPYLVISELLSENCTIKIPNDNGIIQLKENLEKLNSGIDFSGINLRDSLCNVCKCISEFLLSHIDKEKKVLGYTIKDYSDKRIWSAMLSK